MIERSHDSRLDSVARTYLDREVAPSRLVVVAGEDEVSSRQACQCLQRAAAVLGVPTVLLSSQHDAVDLDLAHDRTAPLVVYHHGEVHEGHLDRLRPPGESGVDLLLWDLSKRSKLGLRSLYLLGLWTWALQPRQARCLLPPSVDDGPPLRVLRDRLQAGLQSAGTERPVELLQRPGTWNEESTSNLLAQVLQSLLAASARRASSERVARRAQASGLWAWALWLGVLVGWIAPADLFAQTVSVEVAALDLYAPTTVGEDGSRVLAGAHHLLVLEPGVGTSVSGGGVSVLCDRDQLFAQMDGVPLVFDGTEQRIEGILLLHAPEFTLEVRHGVVRAGPDGVFVRPQLGGTPLPGRQGLFVTGVLLVVIVLLFWRAASVRRRLDQPYVSVRRRKRELGG